MIENEGQEAVTGTGEGFCTAKKEHTGGHDRPLVRSDGLFHILHALIVRVDGHMAPVKTVAFFLQIEAI